HIFGLKIFHQTIEVVHLPGQVVKTGTTLLQKIDGKSLVGGRLDDLNLGITHHELGAAKLGAFLPAIPGNGAAKEFDEEVAHHRFVGGAKSNVIVPGMYAGGAVHVWL